MKRMMSLVLALVILLGVVFSASVTVSADPVMTVSDECIEILKAYEGFCQYPYKDYGQWTVGYGTKCPDDKLDTYKANGITEEEAEELLRVYVNGYVEDILYFANKYSLTLQQNQFDALFLFTYNCGSGWIYNTSTNFHKTMANPNADAATVLYYYGMWCNAGNTPLTGLIYRRLAEANMFLNGVYSKNRPTNYCYVKYEVNGGVAEARVHAYDVNAGAAAPITPTHASMTFDGWYTDKTGGTKVTSLDANLDGATLYARWVNADGSAPTAPETKPEDTTANNTVDIEPPMLVKVTTDELNVRKGPGTNYTSVACLKQNHTISLTEACYDSSGRLWGKYADGWVCLQYTNFEKVMNGEVEEEPAPSEPEPTEPAPTEPAPTEPTPTEPAPSAPEATQPANKTVGTVTANGGLNIRTGPGTGYSRTGEYATGAKIEILEQKAVGATTWGKTDKGWVSMTYVKLDSDTSATPPAQDTGSAGSSIMGTVKVNGTLNIRTGAGTSYGIAGCYSNGARVAILEQKTSGSYTWGKTDRGWVSMTYVVLDGSAPAPAPESSTPAPETGSANTAPSGQTGTIKVSSVLNIRNGAGTGYSIAGYYSNGAKVTILEQKTVGATTWGKTDKGWVSMDYVVMDSQSGSADTSNANVKTVTATCLNIRADATTSSKVVGYLYKGSKVEILETKTVGSDLWGKTAKGWIAMAYTA